ncbi:5'-nucleotidase C-terminal domain-containing protein [Halosimplex litoreum]|uniref:5'-nucleotidase C-terminal domain-containing protein n=1 Tax=Halosimplex litoreum TaxID=1198301 RepID=A0A7T3FZR6_9EURY|nr:5'-nucleotidase C-terminal domain-containing protein [Halosimplex litoreum]QPV63632.1 5'-nucleotidase C-terminal domain-containing protein [Halosimplex litoreum]
MRRTLVVLLVTASAMLAGATPALAVTAPDADESGADVATTASDSLANQSSDAPQVSIREIQEPPNESTDVSPYAGETVTTSGVVTAVRDDGDGYYIQNGTGAYSGVYVYTGGSVSVSVGDRVEITAPITEYYGLTEVQASGAVSATVTGTTAVPEPVTLATGNASREAYEGVLVEVTDATTTSPPDSDGEWSVDDGSGTLAIDDVQTGTDTVPARADEQFESIVGPLSYTFGAYKIQPKAVESAATGTTVTVLAYTDIGSEAAGDGTMGRFISLVNDRRAAVGGPVAVVGNGDEISPHALRGRVSPGWEPPIRALNIIDPAAEAVQNHELDYDESAETGDFSIFEAASNGSAFPWVNANVRSASQELPGTENHTVVQRGDQRIGIVSVADGAIDSKAGNVLSRNGYAVENYTAAAQREASYLKTEANVDVVVALAPIGNELARDLANDTQYVDAIVTGDRDGSFEPEVVGGAVVTHPPGGAQGVAELKLTVRNGSVTPVGGQTYDVTDDLSRNSTWAQYIDGVRAEYGLDAVIAQTEIPLSTAVDPYTDETAMGNAIAEGVRNYTDADVALTNSGGIRGSATYGPNITASHIRSTLSFGNQVVTMNVTGQELYAILESQMFVYQNDGGPSIGLQSSGTTFEWVPHNETDIPDTALDEGFGRLEDVHVDGEPLDRDATYTLATNSYIGTGASDYPMSESMWTHEYNATMAQAVIEWLDETGTVEREMVDPVVQGNMRMVDRIVDTSDVTTADGTVTVTAQAPSATVDVTDEFYLRNASAGRVNATGVSYDGSTLTVTFDRSDWEATVDSGTAQVYGEYYDSEYTAQLRDVTGGAKEYSVLNVEATVDSNATVPPGAVYSPGTAAAEFDDNDRDGRISITELSDAANAYAAGDLSIADLATVADAFAAS